jgi:hypothetical protein
MMHQPEIDFESRLRRRQEQIAMLQVVFHNPLPGETKPPTIGRIRGVCTLLNRLVLFARSTDETPIRISKAKLAHGILSREAVSEKSIQRWTATAQAMGVLDVVVASQEVGGRAWNEFIIQWGMIERLIDLGRAGDEHVCPGSATRSGLKPAGHGWTRLDTVSTPGLDTVSTPLNALKKSSSIAVCLSDDGPDPHQRASERAQTLNLVTASPVRVDPDEANRIVELLQAQGWDDGARRKADQWLAQGKTVGEIEFQCRVFAAWRAAFDSPGAIATKIEHRYWPNRKGARFRAPQWPDDGPMLAEREAVVAAETEAAKARAMAKACRMARHNPEPMANTSAPRAALAWDSLSPAEQAARIAAVKNQNRLLARLPDNSPLILDAVRHVPDG